MLGPCHPTGGTGAGDPRQRARAPDYSLALKDKIHLS
jgi:hypothetical protein